ncbi:MAG TPA: type IV pilus secretin PilQ [Gammaproteobacteria bacterium]|nr:type IV pilus secretin PilQ [Gammaproteobacteria bacterium]
MFITLLSMLALQVYSLPGYAAGNSLEELTLTSLPGDRVEIRLNMANTAQVPVSFTIDDPARIAFDLTDTTNKLKKHNRAIGVGVARSINTVEARGRTRVVINLAEMVSYDTRVDGNDIIITLDSGAGTTAASARPQSIASSPAMTKTGGTQTKSVTSRYARATHSIKNVDFRRGESGEGRVIIELSDPSIPVDMREEGGKIIVDFLDSSLPTNLERRLDVIDFATPVKEIDTISRGNGVRIIITPLSDYEHLAYQTGDVYTIELKPTTKDEKAAAKKKKFGYTGERLSLNFQNIEVRAVLQLLADFTGLNMVVSDSVTGSVTLRLKNVPWDQAMDIILKTKGLGQRKNDNVILIAPSAEIAAREKLELESQKQIAELAPLRTEWFQINYASGGDIASLLKSSDNNLLSPRGSITVDGRTNTLLIQDTSDRLADIREVISRLDIPVRQVLIESRIVIANDDFSRDLGVKFGISKFTNFNDRSELYAGADAINGNAATLTPNNLITNLPAGPANAGKFGIAVGVINNHLLQLELQALDAEGRGEVISSPRLVTANQKEAFIEQGVEIPYERATSSGATSVQFKKAVLSLTVKPQITPDDRIILDLNVTKDAPDFSNQVRGVPPVNTREIETQVLVDNGETIVLGGIYEQNTTYKENRIPWFGELPMLGFLFRDNHTLDNKNELLIFVTPKILKESYNKGIR